MSPRLVLASVASALAFCGGLAAGPRAETASRQLGPPPPRDPTQQTQVRRIPVGTAAISGTVTSAGGGRPLARSRVNLSGTSTVPMPTRTGAPASTVAAPPGMALARSVVTDEQGRFTFDALPAGQFNISVSRDQYLQTNYGATKPNRPGTAIRLADGQHVPIKIEMLRGGVITGMVFGLDGEPAVSAQVRAMRFTLVSGVRRLSGSGFAQTDDRGVYRMFGLQPGDYVIAATPGPGDLMSREQADREVAAFQAALAAASAERDPRAAAPAFVTVPVETGRAGGQPAGYAPTYYPSATVVASASTIALAPGEERLGVDISVIPVRAVNVTGIVSGIPGPTVAVQISLSSDDPSGDGVGLPGTRAGADGTFMLVNVPPGDYTVFAQTVAPPNPAAFNGPGPFQPPPQLDATQRLWGRVPLRVDGQSASRVVIDLQPARTISGSVVFDMAQPPPTRAAFMVTLTSAPAAQTAPIFGPPVQAAVGSDGRFTLNGVLPGRYMLRATGGLTKSAIVNGEDTLDFPLVVAGDHDIANVEITLTDRSTDLSGTFSESSGLATSDYTIVVAASDQRFWIPGSRRIVVTRPAVDGRYTVRNLPPGDYVLAAVTDVEPGGQYDPEFLRGLSAAGVRVTLTEGGKATQDIRVAR